MQDISALLQLLDLEQIEENIFRGQSYQAPWGQIYGGQVLAQSLRAATLTVPENRFAHSMHAYFILPGDIHWPVLYEVDRIRDGGSFTTRRVVAIQKGRAIFNMAASFQLEQEGFEHQSAMPEVAPPEELVSDLELSETLQEELPPAFKLYQRNRPIEFRLVEKDASGTLASSASLQHPPVRHVWMKAKGIIPEDKFCHQEVLAYACDSNLLATALLPHRHLFSGFEDIQLASLDHAMWFHRDFRMDEWLLYALDSPSASNARGFARGSVYKRDGTLVASVVQEGLMRKRRKSRT